MRRRPGKARLLTRLQAAVSLEQDAGLNGGFSSPHPVGHRRMALKDVPTPPTVTRKSAATHSNSRSSRAFARAAIEEWHTLPSCFKPSLALLHLYALFRAQSGEPSIAFLPVWSLR